MEDANNEREKTAEPVKKTPEMNGLLPIKASKKKAHKKDKSPTRKNEAQKRKYKKKPMKTLKTP